MSFLLVTIPSRPFLNFCSRKLQLQLLPQMLALRKIHQNTGWLINWVYNQVFMSPFIVLTSNGYSMLPLHFRRLHEKNSYWLSIFCLFFEKYEKNPLLSNSSGRMYFFKLIIRKIEILRRSACTMYYDVTHLQGCYLEYYGEQ